MAQKTLFKNKKGKKKDIAVNLHGKTGLTKRGKFQVKPKRDIVKQRAAENEALTHAINAKNEAKFAGIAAQKGGHLSVIKPPATEAAAQQRGPKNKK